MSPDGSLLADHSDVRAEPAVALLERWLDLGEVERRAFLAMAEELTVTSDLIERSTLDLTARFRDLAAAAATQTARVERVAAIAKAVEVDGRPISMTQATGLVETALVDAVGALENVASQAATMVRALDDVVRDVADAEQCVARIETINTQARFVALNATIEANRAATSGGAFKVIAHELKELSLATDSTSKLVRERIASIARAVRAAHAQLKAIAGADTSGHAATRRQLDSVLAGMVGQNRALGDVLDETMESSAEMAGTIARLVTGAQFQDRTTQHLMHISDALKALGEIAESLQHETRGTVPALRDHHALSEALIHRLLDGQTLSTVRQRFFAKLVGGGAMAEAEQADPGGDVELF